MSRNTLADPNQYCIILCRNVFIHTSLYLLTANILFSFIFLQQNIKHSKLSGIRQPRGIYFTWCFSFLNIVIIHRYKVVFLKHLFFLSIYHRFFYHRLLFSPFLYFYLEIIIHTFIYIHDFSMHFLKILTPIHVLY